MKKFIFLALYLSQTVWGWGEVGHHIIARSAVEILKSHPLLISSELKQTEKDSVQSFLNGFKSKQYQQGHLANIPDTHWRNLDHGLEETGTLLGSPSHYFDSENIFAIFKTNDFSQIRIPLTYEEAKKNFPSINHFFDSVGSLPWRAQQFTDLYAAALKSNTGLSCAANREAEFAFRKVTAYAGLLAHFTGDVSMPYHTSIDHDAIAVGQKGIHSYFEQDLVTELELSDLYRKVVDRAVALMNSANEVNGTPTLEILRQRSKEVYPSQLPNQETSALMMVLMGDSFSLIEKLRQLDYSYAIATLDEALKNSQCQKLPITKELKSQFDQLESDEQRRAFGKVKVLSQPGGYREKNLASACRRTPSTRVNKDGELAEDGKTVAEWHEELILNRLALSAALTADIWIREWLKNGSPRLCSTFLYAHKPSFVSPTDSKCSGYALSESPKDFLKKNGKSALIWKPSTNSPDSCVSF
jgi:hypothetical protein